MERIDRSNFADKLKDYERVDVKSLKAGDHVRYIRKEFGTEKYKCVYSVIASCEEGQDISMHSYVPKDSTDPPYSWILKNTSVPYVRFYQKVKK
jgi:hypothetical protein